MKLPFLYSIPVAVPNISAFLIGRIADLHPREERSETDFFRNSSSGGHCGVAQALEASPICSDFCTPRTPFISSTEASFEKSLMKKLLHPLQKKIAVEHLSSSLSSSFHHLSFITAEQTHGSEIAVVSPPLPKEKEIENVDALITHHSGIILGIAVADCSPVWILERRGKIGAIVHSGKKGTLAEIVPKTIFRLRKEFLINPADLIVIIGPCIRPPCYEIDFAKIIDQQASDAGVTTIYDDKICTACHPDRYYSYRREKGKTGRMLAVLYLS